MSVSNLSKLGNPRENKIAEKIRKTNNKAFKTAWDEVLLLINFVEASSAPSVPVRSSSSIAINENVRSTSVSEPIEPPESLSKLSISATKPMKIKLKLRKSGNGVKVEVKECPNNVEPVNIQIDKNKVDIELKLRQSSQQDVAK